MKRGSQKMQVKTKPFTITDKEYEALALFKSQRVTSCYSAVGDQARRFLS